MGLFNIFTKDMGIDLGTANTVVYVKDKGLVVREPSVVALDQNTGEVLAVGQEAKNMIGRTPGNIIAVRPLRDGVIADFDITQSMLKYFFNKAYPQKSIFVGPRVIVGIPSGVTEVERRSVEEAAIQAGAKAAYLIEEPMAAAIGAGLPIEEPTGNMIVDIGGGTTEIAVISLGGIVTSKSVRVGGDELDDSIVQYVKKNYNLMIGERTAEDVKMKIGCAYPKEEPDTMEIRGRDLVSGLPKTIEITSTEILNALSEPVNAIVEAIKVTLEKAPPELAADIIERGIVLAGGGALLTGLDKLITEETEMSVIIAENPLDCVALGTGKTIQALESLKRVLIKTRRFR